MKKRRVSEDEIRLFKAVIDVAGPVRAQPPLKTKPSVKTKTAAKALAQVRAAAKVETEAKTGRGAGLNASLETRLRRGVLMPEARLDLHGFSESVAHGALLSFLRSAQRRDHRLVLVITGKGARPAPDAPFDMASGRRGILKSAVPRWLKEAPFAALIGAVRPAHRRHGGDGALYIYLRKNR
jgi:DNA-nicking Smr family endonuclease